MVVPVREAQRFLMSWAMAEVVRLVSGCVRVVGVVTEIVINGRTGRESYRTC